MDELITRLVDHTGVTRAVAEKAVGIIFNFLLKEGPTETVQGLIVGRHGSGRLPMGGLADGESE